MTDWKDDRNRGPWPFVKQTNKWGYLNNPRWINPATAKVSYDGVESTEPQVWSLPDQFTPQSVGDQTKHDPCGHWHQKIEMKTIPDTYLYLLPSDTANVGTTTDFIGGYCIESECPFDPTDYDGIESMTFEATMNNALDVPYTLYLKDLSGYTYASLTIPANTTGPETYGWFTYRVGFTKPTSAITFVLFSPATAKSPDDSNFLWLSEARIKISYGPNVTKAVSQIPLNIFPGGWEVNLGAPNRLPGSNYLTASEDDYVFDDASVATVWKYNSDELQTINSLQFRQLGSGVHGESWRTNTIYMYNEPRVPIAPPLGDYPGDSCQLYYSDDDGATKIPIVETLSYYDGSSDWSVSYSIDPSILNTSGRIFSIRFSNILGYIDSIIIESVLLDTYTAGYLTFSIAPEVNYPYDPGYSIECYIHLDYSATVPNPLSAALFDLDINTMLEGSELIWESGELTSWKTANIDPNKLIDGHSYAVKYKTTSSDFDKSPCVSGAVLIIKVVDITKFTSWQRVAKSNLWDYWSIPVGWGSEYGAKSWGVTGGGIVGVECSLKYKAIINARIRYEVTNYLWDILDYDTYQALWNNDNYTDGCTEGLNRIDSSVINYSSGDIANYPTRKVSGEVIGLVDGNEICNIQPDCDYFIYAGNGFLVISV